MIRIFNGYEIDGSDTSFYLLTDKKELLPRLIDFFINLPIFDRARSFCLSLNIKDAWTPHRGIGDRYEEKGFAFEDYGQHKKSISEAIQNEKGFYFVVPCQIPMLLSKDIRKELFEFTEIRPSGEKEYIGMSRPEGELERDIKEGNEVSFWVSFEKSKSDSDDIDGMILNRKSLEDIISKPAFSISFGCGPGFYYEYAAWIMNKIASEFPEIGIYGGLDCGGGFNNGCTYANTIYSYERFELPWKKAEFALSQLTPTYFLPMKRFSLWETKRKDYGDDYLCLVNSIDLIMGRYLNNQRMFDYLSQIGRNDRAIRKDKYQEFCTALYSESNISDEELIATTAVGLLIRVIPSKKKMKDYEINHDEYMRRCYLVAVRKDGHIGCEIWVRKQYIDKAKEILSELAKRS